MGRENKREATGLGRTSGKQLGTGEQAGSNWGRENKQEATGVGRTSGRQLGSGEEAGSNWGRENKRETTTRTAPAGPVHMF